MIGEEGGSGGVHACGWAAFEFGADRVEVHEPTLEQGPRHLLQKLVGLPVQLDQVVQGAEDVGDGTLGGERWDGNFYRLKVSQVYDLLDRPEGLSTEGRLPFARLQKVAYKPRVNSRLKPDQTDLSGDVRTSQFRWSNRDLAGIADERDEDFPAAKQGSAVLL